MAPHSSHPSPIMALTHLTHYGSSLISPMMAPHSSHPSWLLTCLTYHGSSLISPIMAPQLSHPPWLIRHLTHHGSSLISQIMASSDVTLKDCWSWYLVFFCCSYESCLSCYCL